MMNGFLFVLSLLSALSCGVVAGVFFAFSAFVMKALGRLPAEHGVAAMQAINVAAVTPAFMAALFGTALVGGGLYLVGTILLTILYHVPRNEALARVEPHSTDAEKYWRRYLSGWTAWNHLRAAAALAAAAVLTIALHVG